MTTKINPNQINGALGSNPVVTISTTNLALATDYENGDTVNGVVLVTGDSILLTAQSPASDNGLYTVNASGAPTKISTEDGSLFYATGGGNAGQTLVQDGTSYDTQSSGGVSGSNLVKTVSLANLALATDYENGDTVNGYVLVTGDLVLLTAQTPSTDNGLYSVNASGAPTKISESVGAMFYVSSGTSAGSTYIHSATTTYELQASNAGVVSGVLGGTAISNLTTLSALSLNDAVYGSSATATPSMSIVGKTLLAQNGTGITTTSFTVSGNANRGLYFYCTSTNFTAGNLSITYNGVTATPLENKTVGGATQVRTYYLIAPASGANNIATDPGGFNASITIEVFEVNGVSQTLNPDNTIGTSTTNFVTFPDNSLGTITNTPSANTTGGMMVALRGDGNSALSIVPGSNWTALGAVEPIVGYYFPTGGISSTTAMSATIDTAGGGSGIVTTFFPPAIPATFAVSKTSASLAGTTNTFVGFVSAAYLSGATNVTVYNSGILDGFTGLSVGSTYYLSNTAGGISTSPGTNSKKVGVAITDTVLAIINTA